MDIIFLGTGAGAPTARRGYPGILIKAGGLNILVDAGSGTMRQLAKAGLNHCQLDVILFTHFHPDHIGDLPSILFAIKYRPVQERRFPARVVGPQGLFDLYNGLYKSFGRWVEPPESSLTMEELPKSERRLLDLGDVTVESGPVPHNPESLGYRFREKDGPIVAITGDSDFGPDLVELAVGACMLITECSFPEGMKRRGHLTPGLAGRTARLAGVESLVITHFYPEADEVDLIPQIKQEFDGRIILAEDLLALSI